MPINDLTYYDNFNQQLADETVKCLVYVEDNLSTLNEAPNENGSSPNNTSYQENETFENTDNTNVEDNPSTLNETPNENGRSSNASHQKDGTPNGNSTTNVEDNPSTSKETPNENVRPQNNTPNQENETSSYKENETPKDNSTSNVEQESSSTQDTSSDSETGTNSETTSTNNNSTSSNNANQSSNNIGGGGNQSSPPANNSNSNSYSESSYTDQVATNFKLSIGRQLDGISSALNQPAPNATAKALNVAEAGVQAFGLVAGLAQNLIEGAMLPIFAAFGMKGMATLPVSKQMDAVIGIDVHFVTLPIPFVPPPGPPIPMPHPYVGMLFRAKDFLSIAAAYFLPPPPPPPTLPENPSDAAVAAANFAKALSLGNTVASIAISMVGATVAVGTYPRVVAGTPTKSIPHFPIGTGFHPTYIGVAKNNGHAFMGSLLALADDDPISGGWPHMHLNCNDVGIPSPHTLRPSKNTSEEEEIKRELYLPTGLITPIPPGKPVVTNPLPVPFNPISAIAKKINASFGRFLKKIGIKLLRQINRKILKKPLMQRFKFTKKLSDAICRKFGDPVDIATGVVFYESEDFSLSGPYPINWKKCWYSDSEYKGMLGQGFHCNYDLTLHIVPEDELIALRLPDGRMTAFPILQVYGDNITDRNEKVKLTYIDGNTYEVLFMDSLETYTFSKIDDNLFRPVKAKNNQGFEIKFYYDEDKQLTQIIDAVGRQINLKTNADGFIAEVSAKYKGKERTLVKYGYENKDLTHITDALNKTTAIAYQNHLMVKKTDRNGQSFYWEYDGNKTGAKCIKTWGDKGILSGTLSYHDGYTITTNSLGNQTRYDIDENNLITKITDAYGYETTTKYNQYFEVIAETDEEGNTTNFSYDGIGNLTAITQPDSTQIVYEYDDNNRLISTNYPEGGSVIRTYNDDGKLQAFIGLDENLTSFAYNELGLISEVRDANGKTTSLTYDEDFNLVKMILPNKAEANWEYDEWGRCTKTVNNEGHQQQFFYDELDRIKEIQQADNNIINLQYNAYDEVVALKDKQRNVNFEYTLLGSLKTREENGVKVHFKYDTEEDLLEITNEHSEKYNFNRNQNGEIIKESGFDGLTRFYNRDRAGKVIKVNRPGNKFTEYEYDLNSKITRAEHSDGTWETFNYNRDGLLVEAANENSLVELMRDPSGKIIKELQNEYEVESTYDKLGNRIKITSSLGANIDVERDDMGLVKQQSATVNNGEDNLENQQAWTAQFKYNSLGMEVERLLPGGIINTFEYDKAGRPIRQKVSATNRELRHRTYKWNVNDRLTTMVNQLTSGTVNYSHDDFGNLASAQYENGEMDYKLPDEVGNLYRTEKRKDREYGPGAQLLRAGDNCFRYDEEGNLIEKETPKGNWKYDWYGNGMLKSVNRPDGKKVDFEYDALGRRTAKIVSESSLVGNSQQVNSEIGDSLWLQGLTTQKRTEGVADGTITRFIWDGNVPLHEWIYDVKDRPNLVVDELGFLNKEQDEPVNNLITWVFDEGTFKPAAKIVDGEQYSIITDYLGTPVEMYNSQGEKTWQAEYDIYGKIRKLIAGSLNDCPFRYQGQYEDMEIGLYYNRFRYYSANDGIYISQDPIKLAGRNPNIYAYVKDSNTWIDVLGLECKPITNKFPKESLPKDGKIVDFEIVDGFIKGVNGQRHFDFIVTTDNRLIIGKKHHTLGNRSDVLAAGQIRLNGQGKIKNIDNLSGHYRPTVDEANNFPKVLEDAGLDIEGATLNRHDIIIDEDGYVIRVIPQKPIKL